MLELSKQYLDNVVTFLQITKMQDDNLILKPLQMQHDTLCDIHSLTVLFYIIQISLKQSSLNVVQKPQQT